MRLVFILIAIVVVILLIRSITKNRNTQESQLGVFEHPSTFKKPKIEMVTKESMESETTDSNDQNDLDDVFDIYNN